MDEADSRTVAEIGEQADRAVDGRPADAPAVERVRGFRDGAGATGSREVLPNRPALPREWDATRGEHLIDGGLV